MCNNQPHQPSHLVWEHFIKNRLKETQLFPILTLLVCKYLFCTANFLCSRNIEVITTCRRWGSSTLKQPANYLMFSNKMSVHQQQGKQTNFRSHDQRFSSQRDLAVNSPSDSNNGHYLWLIHRLVSPLLIKAINYLGNMYLLTGQYRASSSQVNAEVW